MYPEGSWWENVRNLQRIKNNMQRNVFNLIMKKGEDTMAGLTNAEKLAKLEKKVALHEKLINGQRNTINALDEAQGGHVSIIAIKIDTKNHVCSIMDNGRGIPISKNVPIIISTELFSGAKFQDNKTAYEIASGLHGVGLVCANALSDFYNVEIYRNDKHAIFNFVKGKLKKKSIISISAFHN